MKALIAPVRFAVAPGALVAMSLTAGAQTVEVSGTPTCSACVVEFVRIGSAGTAADPVLVGEMNALKRGPRGTLVTTSHDGYQLVLFDSTGRYLRAVGTRGQGPGEFASPVRILGLDSHDSLWVDTRRSIFVYSPELTLARTVTSATPRPASWHFLAEGRVVQIAALTRPVANSLHVLYTLQPGDSIAAPFGTASSDDPVTCIACMSRAVAVTPDRRAVHVVHPNRYRVDSYDSSGQLRSTLQVTGSRWMTEWSRTRASGPGATEPPNPMIHAVVAAAGGRLIMVGRTPARNWAAPTLPAGAASARIGGNAAIIVNSDASRELIAQNARNYNTVVDVIDPSGRQLISSTTIEGEMFLHLHDDLFQVRRVTADGIVVYDIYRLLLRDRERER